MPTFLIVLTTLLGAYLLAGTGYYLLMRRRQRATYQLMVEEVVTKDGWPAPAVHVVALGVCLVCWPALVLQRL